MYCYSEDLLDLHYNTNHSVAKFFFDIMNCIVYNNYKSETHVRNKIYLGHVEGSLNARKSYQEKCCTYAFDTNEHNA